MHTFIGNEILERNNNWIYCSDRVPDYDVPVLLSLEDCHTYIGYRTNILNKERYYTEGLGYIKCKDVIAWMPIPHRLNKKG